MSTKVNFQSRQESTYLSNSTNKYETDSNVVTYKKTARIVGVLFITATVASSLGLVILDPVLTAPDILVNVSANTTQVIIGVLLLLINCAAVVAIPILLFPILKKQNKVLAIGYLGFRIIESSILIVGAISLLLLLTLSQRFVQAAVPDVSYFQTNATLLLAINDWSLLLGIMIVFGLTALILNYLLYQSKLVPRWLSGWGLIGAILLLAAGLLELFGFEPTEILSLPIALQEMVFAVWLIVKGFNPTAIDSRSAK